MEHIVVSINKGNDLQASVFGSDKDKIKQPYLAKKVGVKSLSKKMRFHKTKTANGSGNYDEYQLLQKHMQSQIDYNTNKKQFKIFQPQRQSNIHSEQGPRSSNDDLTKINEHFKARLTQDFIIKENNLDNKMDQVEKVDLHNQNLAFQKYSNKSTHETLENQEHNATPTAGGPLIMGIQKLTPQSNIRQIEFVDNSRMNGVQTIKRNKNVIGNQYALKQKKFSKFHRNAADGRPILPQYVDNLEPVRGKNSCFHSSNQNFATSDDREESLEVFDEQMNIKLDEIKQIKITREISSGALKQRYQWLKGMKQKRLSRENAFHKDRVGSIDSRDFTQNIQPILRGSKENWAQSSHFGNQADSFYKKGSEFRHSTNENHRIDEYEINGDQKKQKSQHFQNVSKAFENRDDEDSNDSVKIKTSKQSRREKGRDFIQPLPSIRGSHKRNNDDAKNAAELKNSRNGALLSQQHQEMDSHSNSRNMFQKHTRSTIRKQHVYRDDEEGNIFDNKKANALNTKSQMKKQSSSNNSFKKMPKKNLMNDNGLSRLQFEQCMLLGEQDTLYQYMAMNSKIRDKAARNKSNNPTQKNDHLSTIIKQDRSKQQRTQKQKSRLQPIIPNNFYFANLMNIPNQNEKPKKKANHRQDDLRHYEKTQESEISHPIVNVQQKNRQTAIPSNRNSDKTSAMLSMQNPSTNRPGTRGLQPIDSIDSMKLLELDRLGQRTDGFVGSNKMNDIVQSKDVDKYTDQDIINQLTQTYKQKNGKRKMHLKPLNELTKSMESNKSSTNDNNKNQKSNQNSNIDQILENQEIELNSNNYKNKNMSRIQNHHNSKMQDQAQILYTSRSKEDSAIEQQDEVLTGQAILHDKNKKSSIVEYENNPNMKNLNSNNSFDLENGQNAKALIQLRNSFNAEIGRGNVSEIVTITNQSNSIRLSPIAQVSKERPDAQNHLNDIEKECVDSFLYDKNQTCDDNYQSKRFSLNRVTESSQNQYYTNSKNNEEQLKAFQTLPLDKKQQCSPYPVGTSINGPHTANRDNRESTDEKMRRIGTDSKNRHGSVDQRPERSRLGSQEAINSNQKAHGTNLMNQFQEQSKAEKAQQLEQYLKNKRQEATNTTSQSHHKSREINRQFLKRQIESQAVEQGRMQSISPTRSPTKNIYEPDMHDSIEGDQAAPTIENQHSISETGHFDKILCAIKTNEPYLKRAVERRGKYWYDNKCKFSGGHGVYDIKFEFQDQPQDYSNLRNCQMFNHFQFNTEITTKSGICKTLYANTYPGMNVDDFFPRCYDLSQQGQSDELIDDYYKTSMQNIIKKHYKMFKKLCNEKMKKAYNDFMALKEKRNSGKGAYNYQNDKSNLCWDFIKEHPLPENIFVNKRQLDRTLKFCKQFLKSQYSEDNMNDFVKDEFRPHDTQHNQYLYGYGTKMGHKEFVNQAGLGTQSLTKLFNEKAWQQLIQYSKLRLPICDFSKLPGDLRPMKKDLKQLQEILLNPNMGRPSIYYFSDTNHGWVRPNMHLIYRVMKYHQIMKKLVPQYSTDGERNIWIVKPCYNARGFGIYCIDNCLQEFTSSLKNNQAQSKIVQKYIENPLLIEHKNEVRKFDIRQWVLVTSYDPLQIYIFSEFYLRICGSKYELDDIQDSYKHLTNFSIQKHNSKVSNKEQDLVLNQADFFKKALKNDQAKCLKVRKGMEDIIIKTIRSGQEAGIEHRNNCFEVYGFDFMLDKKLNPWLLEVNLSPACAERTDWLISMLDRMADGLFDLLERRIYKVTDDFKGELRAYLRRKRKAPLETNDWKLIYDQTSQQENYVNLEKSIKESLPSTFSFQQQFNETVNGFGNMSLTQTGFTTVRNQAKFEWGSTQTQQVAQADQSTTHPLELYGTKIQTRLEKKVQNLYTQDLATRIIQKRYRAYQAKKTVVRMKFELIVIYIQSYIRMFLAKNERKRLSQEKNSVTVQKYLRKYLAKKVYFKLLDEYYDLMKLKKVQMIQRNARRYIAKQRENDALKNKCAALIQKYMKGMQHKKKIMEYKRFLQKVLIIQQFYKKAVKKFLKKRQKTMNQTRRCQFVWKMFCRLLKYYKCVEACRLMTSKMRSCVTKIENQWRVQKLRQQVFHRIQKRKATLIQKILRTVLYKKRMAHYQRHIDAVLTIQATFRMIKERKVYQYYLSDRYQKECAHQKFTKQYMKVFNQKPKENRIQRINSLLDEKQQILFLKDAVKKQQLLLGVESFSGQIHPTKQAGREQVHQKRIGGPMFDMNQISNAIHRYKDLSNSKSGQQALTANERREKTMKALKYIQKHKHLYQSGSSSKGDYKEIRRKFKVEKRQDEDAKQMKSFRGNVFQKTDLIQATYVKNPENGPIKKKKHRESKNNHDYSENKHRLCHDTVVSQFKKSYYDQAVSNTTANQHNAKHSHRGHHEAQDKYKIHGISHVEKQHPKFVSTFSKKFGNDERQGSEMQERKSKLAEGLSKLVDPRQGSKCSSQVENGTKLSKAKKRMPSGKGGIKTPMATERERDAKNQSIAQKQKEEELRSTKAEFLNQQNKINQMHQESVFNARKTSDILKQMHKENKFKMSPASQKPYAQDFQNEREFVAQIAQQQASKLYQIGTQILRQDKLRALSPINPIPSQHTQKKPHNGTIDSNKTTGKIPKPTSSQLGQYDNIRQENSDSIFTSGRSSHAVREYQSSTNGTSDRKRFQYNQMAEADAQLSRNESQPLNDVPRQTFDDNETTSSKVSKAQLEHLKYLQSSREDIKEKIKLGGYQGDEIFSKRQAQIVPKRSQSRRKKRNKTEKQSYKRESTMPALNGGQQGFGQLGVFKNAQQVSVFQDTKLPVKKSGNLPMLHPLQKGPKQQETNMGFSNVKDIFDCHDKPIVTKKQNMLIQQSQTRQKGTMGIPTIDKMTHYIEAHKQKNSTFQIQKDPAKEFQKLQPINFNSDGSNNTMGRTTFPSEQQSIDGVEYAQSLFSKKAREIKQGKEMKIKEFNQFEGESEEFILACSKKPASSPPMKDLNDPTEESLKCWLKPMAENAGKMHGEVDKDSSENLDEYYNQDDFLKQNANPTANASYRDSMKNVPVSKEEKEMYHIIHSAAQSSQGANSLTQRKRKGNMINGEEDALIISDCGMSSLAQSIDASVRQRFLEQDDNTSYRIPKEHRQKPNPKEPYSNNQLPLIAQSIYNQALQTETINKKRKTPLAEKQAKQLRMSKNGSSQQLKQRQALNQAHFAQK